MALSKDHVTARLLVKWPGKALVCMCTCRKGLPWCAHVGSLFQMVSNVKSPVENCHELQMELVFPVTQHSCPSIVCPPNPPQPTLPIVQCHAPTSLPPPMPSLLSTISMARSAPPEERHNLILFSSWFHSLFDLQQHRRG